jgi:hypothetical protein
MASLELSLGDRVDEPQPPSASTASTAANAVADLPNRDSTGQMMAMRSPTGYEPLRPAD